MDFGPYLQGLVSGIHSKKIKMNPYGQNLYAAVQVFLCHCSDLFIFEKIEN
jgi:hypothetical protein